MESEVEKAALHALDFNHDGKVDIEDVKRFVLLTEVVMILIGFNLSII